MMRAVEVLLDGDAMTPRDAEVVASLRVHAREDGVDGCGEIDEQGVGRQQIARRLAEVVLGGADVEAELAQMTSRRAAPRAVVGEVAGLLGVQRGPRQIPSDERAVRAEPWSQRLREALEERADALIDVGPDLGAPRHVRALESVAERDAHDEEIAAHGGRRGVRREREIEGVDVEPEATLHTAPERGLVDQRRRHEAIGALGSEVEVHGASAPASGGTPRGTTMTAWCRSRALDAGDASRWRSTSARIWTAAGVRDWDMMLRRPTEGVAMAGSIDAPGLVRLGRACERAQCRARPCPSSRVAQERAPRRPMDRRRRTMGPS